DRERAQCDLTAETMETDNGVAIQIEYNTDLFNGEWVERLCTNFVRLLASASLPMLGDAERHRLLHDFNPPSPPPAPSAPLLHELFARQAHLSPSAPALTDSRGSLSYAEVAVRASALAWALRRAGVAEEMRVGILMRRTRLLPVALLGVLGAGASYVPLDA